MDTLRTLCNRVLWIHEGHLVADGSTDEVIRAYEADSLQNG